MRKLVGTKLCVVSLASFEKLRVAAITVTAAVAIVVVGGALGRAPGGERSVAESGDRGAAVDRLEQTITRAQERLRTVPGDWQTWAALGVAYLERSRITTDPTYYPKAEAAVDRSLAVKPDGNTPALVAQGALANARHDFAAGRRSARAAIAINGYHADAYAVLADAETQLGNREAASAAVQRLLDLRPGLSAYARASYDLEQRGQVAQATDLMRRALDTAVSPSDIAFCRAQLGDLAFNTGDLVAAEREYSAGLNADPSSVALQRGRARVAAAHGRLEEALGGYAGITAQAPTPSYLVEYAELLRVAGRFDDAKTQLSLASAAHKLFTGNGGVDGLTAVALAQATAAPEVAVKEARAEWTRRKHADVADALAWALHLAGRDREALTYARVAHGTGARSATYAYHLGMIELALGDPVAAREHLGQALRLNPHFSPVDGPVARRTLAGLESR
jgi:tetratricopeptide (TPR) repeat protein